MGTSKDGGKPRAGIPGPARFMSLCEVARQREAWVKLTGRVPIASQRHDLAVRLNRQRSNIGYWRPSPAHYPPGAACWLLPAVLLRTRRTAS